MTPDPIDLLLTGAARFTADLPIPSGTLHGAIACSPFAHASFTTLELDRARDYPAVRAVLVAADIPGENQLGDVVHDEPLLADGEVHCVGQPVALVLADSAEVAWQAAQLVDADWSPLPAVLDLADAHAAGHLIAPPRTFAAGDVDAAWSRCTTVVEGRVDLGGQEHAYLETQAALAIPRDDGSLLIHSATQSPSAVQRAVAAVTGLPMNRVEVQVGICEGWCRQLAARVDLPVRTAVKPLFHCGEDPASDADVRCLSISKPCPANNQVHGHVSPLVLCYRWHILA